MRRASLLLAAALLLLPPRLLLQPEQAARLSDAKPANVLPDRRMEGEAIPVALVRHSHEPLGAQALVCALLCSEDEAVYQQQLAQLAESGARGLDRDVHVRGEAPIRRDRQDPRVGGQRHTQSATEGLEHGLGLVVGILPTQADEKDSCLNRIAKGAHEKD